MATQSNSSTMTGVTLTDPKLFRQACYVDGAWVNARVGATISVDNPATGEIVGTVPKFGAAETRDAIEAAEQRIPEWRKKTAKERAAVLRRWFDLMMANQEDLARLMTTEQGKPLAESRGEVAYAGGFLEWFGEEAKRVYGDTIPGHQPDKRIIVIKQPIGVVACITPWNFPLAMITRKAGPAIAAGCTVVLKPASQTPFSALALAELAERAGVPKGVFNVVTGSAGRNRRRADVESHRPEAVVHRFDRSRQAADDAVRRHREEAVARARRQRAVHRVRRCGSRCGGGGGDCVEVPEHGPDLRVREPDLRAGRRLRRVCGEAGGVGEEAEAGPRARGWSDAGSAHRRQGRREGRGAHPGRIEQGRARRRRAAIGMRSAAASSSRPCWRTWRRAR